MTSVNPASKRPATEVLYQPLKQFCHLAASFDWRGSRKNVCVNWISDSDIHNDVLVPPVSSIDATETPIVLDGRPPVARDLDRVLRWQAVSRFVEEPASRCAGLIAIGENYGVVSEFNLDVATAESVVRDV